MAHGAWSRLIAGQQPLGNYISAIASVKNDENDGDLL